MSLSIGIFSDTHYEFRKTGDAIQITDIIQQTPCDLLLNAGDTHPNKMMRDYLDEEFAKGKGKYVSALGNHDYYGSPIRDDYLITDFWGKKIVATTLWTDFDKGNFFAQRVFEKYLADSWYIQPKGMALSERIKDIHAFHRSIIEREKPEIVVTHHAPHWNSIHPKFRGEGPMNFSFFSDLEQFIRDNPNIKLWVHGHTHNPVDYMIGGCRIVANQLGYPGENFKSDKDYQVKVIEL